MGDTYRIAVTGQEEVIRELDRLGHDMQNLEAAFARISVDMAGEARRLAPVVTGMLVASIAPAPLKYAARIGSSLIYTGPIHWGWPARNIAASLFMSLAADAVVDRATEEINNELGRIIRSRGFN